ncbi:MAG TPA: cyanase [Methylophilaceae bacterium]|nr:cyanase [Methylophilaceae bacterium]
MNKQQMTDAIVTAKVAKGLTWEKIAEDLKVSPVWLTSACLGMNSATQAQAEAIADYLGLNEEIAIALQAYPTKEWDKTVPQDPLIYRLYEIIGVYGPTLKEVIQEKFGDGIMSAIDFSMEVGKEENPKGDRVVVTMNGKFLPYKSW